MPSEYRLKRRVQFYETDMAGIVHFSVDTQRS
jgi:acyl-CoA thioesterase FadM